MRLRKRSITVSDYAELRAKALADNLSRAEYSAAVVELIDENKRLKLVEEVWKLQKHMPAAVVELMDRIEELEKQLLS
jgi:hypothetical protein